LCFIASASGLVNAVEYFKIEGIKDTRGEYFMALLPLLVSGGSANMQALSVTVACSTASR
jgi:hypothetical protein